MYFFKTFNWWMMIQGKNTCSLTRGVRFLECPLIRNFIAFVSLPFTRACVGDQCSFSNLPLPFPKQQEKWNWRNLALFSISESKIVWWQQDPIHNFVVSTNYLVRIFYSQTISKWDHKNLGNLSPPVPSNLLMLP